MQSLRQSDSTLAQFALYVSLGIMTNGLGYILFIIMTYFALGPKLAASVLYLFCAVLSFFGNREITFNKKNPLSGAFIRFAIAHLGGYLLTMVILMIGVDCWDFPSYLIEAIAIIIVAGFLFLALKFFVFQEENSK